MIVRLGLPDTGDAGTAGSSDTGETPTVDRSGEGSDITDTAPEDGSTVTDTDTTVTPDTAGSDTTAGDSADATPPVTLASINAISCRKEPDTTPTPTVAAVAGATEMAEPTVGAAAVNGLAASLSNFPGIVKLEPRNPEPGGAISSGHCGATRIAEHWLVTAAHCVDQPYNELRIIGDAANLRSPLAKITQGELAVCHAGYEGTANGYANDIALIRLDDDEVAALGDVPIARFGNTARTLAPANYPTADMAGWGITSFGGQLSPDLLAANIRITAAGPSLPRPAWNSLKRFARSRPNGESWSSSSIGICATPPPSTNSCRGFPCEPMLATSFRARSWRSSAASSTRRSLWR